MNPMSTHSSGKRIALLATATLVVVAAACGRPDAESEPTTSAATTAEHVVAVRDTMIEATLAASAVAEPILRAVLSTKLMGTVTVVHVREGDRVTEGQPLIEIDARDLVAKEAQVRAGLSAASAMHTEASAHATRIRALFADSAATRAQLDAAESGLARAEAAVEQARAGAAELEAVRSYAIVRAPFGGTVTLRSVDPGDFAAPGAPLVSVQDGRRLRVSATVAPDAARGLSRGARIDARIEGRVAQATIEGVVPASTGNLYTVNATVENRSGSFLPGSSASLLLPQGTRRALLVPAAALRREGDLTGVLVRGSTGDELRWVRLGPTRHGDDIEVLGGVAAGERIVVPVGAPRVHPDSAGN